MPHMQFWDPGLWQELCAAQMGYPIAHSSCQLTTGEDEKNLELKTLKRFKFTTRPLPRLP